MDYYDDYSDYGEDMSVDPDYFYPDIDDKYNVWQDCIHPTLTDGINHFLLPILIANLILKIVCQLSANHIFTNFVTTTTGLSLLYYHFFDDHKLFFSLLVCISLGALVSLSTTKQKTIVWLLCIGFVCLNESLILIDETFLRLRSHIMLLAMKIISFNTLIVEESNKEHLMSTHSTLFSSVTYLLHPLSLLLGVWHPFRLSTNERSFVISILHCLYYLLVSIVFLLLSTCVIHYYIGQKLLPSLITLVAIFAPMSLVYFLEICLTVYITAQQFRFSHYFICFATQSMLCLWNSDLRVTNPMSIEFPRSLVDVVVAWNIPMHIWLKKNVFNPSKRRFGAFKAIFITYFISSFLHGFNFQIWSVLLSLGVLTKLEYELRSELSKIFNSCIHVRRCDYQTVGTDDQNCAKVWHFWSRSRQPRECGSKWKHRNSEHNSKAVIAANFVFALLAIAHLSYLGSTFDGKQESSKMSNVINIWKELIFFSHGLCVFTFVFYFLIVWQ